MKHPILLAKTEEPSEYRVAAAISREDEILQKARDILARRLMQTEYTVDSPSVVKDYLVSHLAEHQHEVFGVLWLDARNGVIKDDQMFRGTLTQTSVYPREVVKAALKNNAAAAILYHNHPSGNPEPSTADEMLTRSLKSALALIDCRTLDHIIVGKTETLSFAERGMI